MLVILMSRTLDQHTNLDGFPKPGEMIGMTGAHALEACERAMVNVLYQHAHDSGRLGEPGAEWEIPLSTLREAYSKHENNGRIRDSLARLMNVLVEVRYIDVGDGSDEPEERVRIMGIFRFLDISAKEFTKRATIRYGISPDLAPIIEKSRRWGRIKAEVVCAMTSKYAMALYEMVQLRANMHRCIESFSIEDFRNQLGVPPGAYERGNNFMQFVIDPAVLEVNGLSDMGVQIEVRRKHARARIDGVTMAWWKKTGDDFRSARQEIDRSKIGRMARLRGRVEAVSGGDNGSQLLIEDGAASMLAAVQELELEKVTAE
jgi:replication initiator protein